MTAPRVTRKFVRALLRKSQRRAKAAPPAYTSEEIELLLGYVADLRKDELQDFLADRKLKKGGNKSEVVARLQTAIDDGALTYGALIDLLDAIEPWGKQHVYLFGKPSTAVADWKSSAWVESHLKANKLHKYLNRHVPFLLPEKLRLTTIEHNPSRIRIVAVERREGYDRDEDLDQNAKNPDGEEVQLRAYVHRITRGLIAFEWDLDKGEAFLQITQLPTHSRYEDAVKRFATLVEDWFPFDKFPAHPIANAIAEFHRLEESGKGSIRSHRVELAAPDGRRLTGSSASSHQSLLGNEDIDTALQSVRDKGGVGHHGNFFFEADAADTDNPIGAGDDVHVTLLGNRDRINVMTPQSEEIVRYVLRRVRAAS